jgi:hypothetical protein
MTFSELPARIKRRLARYAVLVSAQRQASPESKPWLEEIPALVPLLHRFAWAKPEVHQALQVCGVDVVPVNFYSNLPTVQEIESSFEYQGDAMPYLLPEIFDHELLKAWLAELAVYADEFHPQKEGNQETCTRYFWSNGQFSNSDALAYYCFIRHTKPQTIVEIGAGFSTLIASEAMDRNGSGRILCVEPFPRPFLKSVPRAEVMARPAQELTAEWLNDQLADGDLLFIDSTHTVKTGSDCLHIYLRLLPKLRKRLYIHAHDIFLPGGLPKAWMLEKQIFWTEQYLLLALLTDNPRARVVYGSAYHAKMNLTALESFMQGRARAEGASLYFSYRESESG